MAAKKKAPEHPPAVKTEKTVKGRYRVLQKCFINNTLCVPGKVIDYEGGVPAPDVLVPEKSIEPKDQPDAGDHK